MKALPRPNMSESTGIGKEHVLDILAAPKDEGAAQQLLLNLGFKDVKVFRLEWDRVLFTVKDEHAFTLHLQFDQETEKVRLHSVKGWPI